MTSFVVGEDADKENDSEEGVKRCIECEKFQFRVQVNLSTLRPFQLQF